MKDSDILFLLTRLGNLMKENILKTCTKPRTKQGVQPLGESLPLDTPLLLMVDPSNTCNFKCVFCPTGDDELLKEVGRPKGMMQLELFHKIIDDLAAFPKKIKVLHLYKDGEPLANKSLEEMIAYAKSSGQVNRVETTTNGLLLTPKRSESLIDAGLDGIRISVYALNDAGYRDITRTRVAFEKIRANVASLYSQKLTKRPALHVHCKIVDVNLSDEEKELFMSTFSPISDSAHIDTIMGWSNSRDRNFLLGITPQRGMSGAPRTRDRIACSEPFAKLTINYDGSVAACCVDWSHETLVGNSKDNSLFEIWSGEKLKQLRLKHLTGNRDQLSACNSCDYIYGLPHHYNFDHLIDQLLPSYTSK